MSWLQDLFYSMLVWIWDLVLALLTWAFQSAKEGVVAFASYAMDALPSGISDFLSQTFLDASLTAYLTSAVRVCYFIPVGPAALVVITAFTLCGGIRLVRWILAFVPWPGMSS